MYYLKTEQCFDSAHFLHGYHGKCANIHGHRWKIVATIKSKELLNNQQNNGMIIDFKDLKNDLKKISEEQNAQNTRKQNKKKIKNHTLRALSR